ncbi:SPFH/Band 7/PHB domain protein [Salmonella enterica]|uniref:SPFH/Band 7/PHB domain protein n=3 Tax=Salmonella enterica TaxID=28901 RepID=A0A5Z3EDA7_SALER|nr:SPFH domain-containing protein [Salmonella enterica]EAV4758412.1 SPFH/Band 7/PHB domain protein [Salmonella enterica subsp. enterica serovar Muenchen]EBH3182258.1 SPFH/Band 7/PHB domain protein [Salmonella enterica subsp. enterica]ECU7541623.1 SPFH/Band 7/PHB domain protein [Salmonella enterica subsp. enterica serovar Saintpaul]EDU2372429.1 SPFH/Band 7/PHB domain protein [Salmonella enterica subsp. enterica serovar Reading]EDU6089092.1 SPFH/Band 7/PHB domain protein [Salmonella enterica sub
MKKIIFAAVIALSVLALSGCERATVPAGYVGVKVDLYGDEKGVQQSEVGVGKYWLTWNEEIYQFPTFNQLHNYDQPFTFQTADSMDVKARIGVEYYVDPEKVTKIFQTYRKGVDEITEVNLRQNISDALINHSGKMNINSLAAGGKTQLLEQVTQDLKSKLDPIGIKIVKLSWVSDLDYPQKVKESINAKIEATQRALLRENEIAQSKAEAQKAIEQARGEAESTMLRAKAESDAIALRGEALRSNPEVLQLEAINKWNGTLPQYLTSGAATPFIPLK